MNKTAFLFPGQGSQFAGMGKSLAEAYPEAARVFQEADDCLGFSISKLCFEGPEEQLRLTEITQPALLTVSAPFHCPLMQPAQQRLKDDLDATEFRDLTVPLINNWQAREIRTAAEAREGLYQQVPNPVCWNDSMQVLAAAGVTRCLEVGA